jgi:hypothetical protein
MNRKILVRAMLTGALLCGTIIIAQEPMQDIDPHRHPNLAAAQHHVVEANNAIIAAQRDNHGDMQGHAEKAREHLVAANNELKLAAEAANANMKH